MAFLLPALAPILATVFTKVIGGGGNKGTQQASSAAAQAQAQGIQDDIARKKKIEETIAEYSSQGRPNNFFLPDAAGGAANSGDFYDSIQNTAGLDALMRLAGSPTQSNALVNATQDSTRRDIAQAEMAGGLGQSLQAIIASLSPGAGTSGDVDVGQLAPPIDPWASATGLAPVVQPINPPPPPQPYIGPGA